MENFTVWFVENDWRDTMKVSGEVLRVLDEGDESGSLKFMVDGVTYEKQGVLLEVTKTLTAYGYSTEVRYY